MRRLFAAALACVLTDAGSTRAQAAQAPDAAALAQLGRSIFEDSSLSASGRQSCASCHVPEFAHAQANDLPVQPGGADLTVPGFRSVPSLRYLNFGIAFFFDKEGTPTGGFDRDGRAADLIEQARRPFLAPHEMANADAADVAGKLAAASYAGAFRAIFGADVFADAERAFLAALFAVATFESSAPELQPFSSKYDLFLRGKAQLTLPELRGLALFNRKDKGNCAGCHPSTRSADGSPPLFTDFTYDSLGVPRNAQIPATADPLYFDLGLCGPDRTDLADRVDLCGQFKVPTLRNVATRRVFFHNGIFHTLRDALHFYVQRDTDPSLWYPLDANGQPDKYDDLPAPLRGNVNTSEVPYDRKAGQAPRLDDAEIDDVIAFIGTLTDGYDPISGTADPARDLAPRTNR